MILSSLMAWEELEQAYAPQFSPSTGAPAKPVRLAFGALFIKQRLGSVAARKDDASAAIQATNINLAGYGSISGGAGLIQTSSG